MLLRVQDLPDLVNVLGEADNRIYQKYTIHHKHRFEDTHTHTRTWRIMFSVVSRAASYTQLAHQRFKRHLTTPVGLFFDGGLNLRGVFQPVGGTMWQQTRGAPRYWR